MVVCKVHWEYIKSLYFLVENMIPMDLIAIFKGSIALAILSLFFVIAALMFIAAYQWQTTMALLWKSHLIYMRLKFILCLQSSKVLVFILPPWPSDSNNLDVPLKQTPQSKTRTHICEIMWS